jgi:histidyl-tRNA synthetase
MLIEPRTLKGFRDLLPGPMIARERLIDIAKQVYRQFGFVPIETPALEYLEILTGKGSEETDRQMYRFTDHGGRQVGMRFDLTVPLARFVAQHNQQLGLPFKRYHVGTVWRGEKSQAGRYREFVQCDFDTVGTESVVADIETVLVIYQLMQQLPVGGFCIRLNHRQFLSGWLDRQGLAQQQGLVLRAVDKLPKLGESVVAAELQAGGLSSSAIDRVLQLGQLSGSSQEMLEQMRQAVLDHPLGLAAVERLEQVIEGLQAAGVPNSAYRIDLSIARGLDYYTGIVFETLLDALPSIGSVCSGGRYDNLAELYTRQHLPGIGASLGVDRTLAALEQLGGIDPTPRTADVFIPLFDATQIPAYLHLASLIRSFGWNCELYPEAKKLGQQLKYADTRGFPVAVIAGSEELAAGSCQVKDLRHRISTDIAWRDDPSQLQTALAKLLQLAESQLLANAKAT